MSMTKVDYIRMAIDAGAAIDDVIDFARDLEAYCEARADDGSQGSEHHLPYDTFAAGDVIVDALGNRWSLVRA